MATGTQVTTLDIRDQAFAVTVDAHGYFEAIHDGREVRCDTLDKLRERLVVLTKQAAVRVAIPVTRLRGYGAKDAYESGTLTGIHGATRKVLYKGPRGSEQLDNYSARDTIFRPLTKEEADEHVALRAAREAAVEALDRWEAAHRLDASKAVTAAINEAAKGEAGS